MRRPWRRPAGRSRTARAASTSSTSESCHGWSRSRAGCAAPRSPRTSPRRRCSWPTGDGVRSGTSSGRTCGYAGRAPTSRSRSSGRKVVELRVTARLGARRTPPPELSPSTRGVLGGRACAPPAPGPGRRTAVRLRPADRRHRRDPRLHAGHRQAAPEPGPARAGGHSRRARRRSHEPGQAGRRGHPRAARAPTARRRLDARRTQAHPPAAQGRPLRRGRRRRPVARWQLDAPAT